MLTLSLVSRENKRAIPDQRTSNARTKLMTAIELGFRPLTEKVAGIERIVIQRGALPPATTTTPR